MTKDFKSLLSVSLRAIRYDIGTVKDDIREVKHRLTSLEGAVGGLKRDQASSYADVADQQARYDRLAERLERIERRLELSDEL